MAYDDVVHLLGGFGRYQRRIYFLLCLPAILCAFHTFANVFLQAKPNFKCQPLTDAFNVSHFLTTSILNVSVENQTFSSSCSMLQDGKIVPCKNFIFDDNIYKSTIVTEWNLVCSQTYLNALADMMYMVGVMIGSLVLGHMSDRFGRKPTFFALLIVQVIFGILLAAAPAYWIYAACRAVIGATTAGTFLITYVMEMEMVGPKDRLASGVICQLFYSLGFVLTGGFAFYINEWRYLQVAITLPGVLFFCYWWFVPESARWLVSKHRLKEAIQLIQIAAKENKVQISDSELEVHLINDIKQKSSAEKKVNILDIFKHSDLRKRSLLIFFSWFVNNITYYGLSWNTSSLGGNDYLNFVIAGAVEIPGEVFLLFTLNKWGRKTVLCGCMATAGIALLLTAVVPEEQIWILITLTMIGKLAITGSYGTIYIFSTELFPTVIRNASLGACSMAARIGSVLAPVINLTSDAWKPFPMVIFGVLSLLGGGSALLLPETLNRQLPETLSDSEQFFRNRKRQDGLEVMETKPLEDTTSKSLIEASSIS